MSIRSELARPQRVLRPMPQSGSNNDIPYPPQIPANHNQRQQPTEPRLSFGRPPLPVTRHVGPSSNVTSSTIPTQTRPQLVSSTSSSVSTQNPTSGAPRYVSQSLSSDFQPTPKVISTTTVPRSIPQNQSSLSSNHHYNTPSSISTSSSSSFPQPTSSNTSSMSSMSSKHSTSSATSSISTPNRNHSLTSNPPTQQHSSLPLNPTQLLQMQQTIADLQEELRKAQNHNNVLQLSLENHQSVINEQQNEISSLKEQLVEQISANNALLVDQETLKQAVVEDVLQYFESNGVDVVGFQHEQSNIGCVSHSHDVQFALNVYRKNVEDHLNSLSSLNSVVTTEDQPSSPNKLHLIDEINNNPIKLSRHLDELIIAMGGPTQHEYKQHFSERLQRIESMTAIADELLNPNLEKEIEQFDQDFSQQLQHQYQSQCNSFIEQYLKPLGPMFSDTTLQGLQRPTSNDNLHMHDGTSSNDPPLMYFDNESIPPHLLSCDLTTLCDHLVDLEQTCFEQHQSSRRENLGSESQQHVNLYLFGDTVENIIDLDVLQQAVDFGIEDMDPYLGLEMPPVP